MRETTPIPPGPPPFLAVLANPQRWHLIEELARSDRRVQELMDALQEPANLVSYHLRKLREQSLVVDRRSSAPGEGSSFERHPPSAHRLRAGGGVAHAGVRAEQ